MFMFMKQKMEEIKEAHPLKKFNVLAYRIIYWFAKSLSFCVYVPLTAAEAAAKYGKRMKDRIAYSVIFMPRY